MVAAIESLDHSELEHIISTFGAEEMLALIAQVEEEMEQKSDFTLVQQWTEEEEWEAKQEELDRFDNYVVWTLTIRDVKGPRALTWVWVIEMRSGELKARLCLRPSARR